MNESRGKRGPAKGQGGRPVGTVGPEKVRLQCWVLPETLEAIQAAGKPGAVIDKLVASQKTAHLPAPHEPE